MSKEYIKAQTPLPTYFPYPKFLLQMSLSHTARSIPIESFLIDYYNNPRYQHCLFIQTPMQAHVSAMNRAA